MKRNTKKAFIWIIEILESNNIKYKITGGFLLSKLYTKRKISDIDILVSKDDLFKLGKLIGRRNIVYGPKMYKDKYWRIELLTLVYAGQEIDIISDSGYIYNKLNQRFEIINTNINNFVHLIIYGVKVNTEFPEKVIAIKQKLLRKNDRKDLSLVDDFKKS